MPFNTDNPDDIAYREQIVSRAKSPELKEKLREALSPFRKEQMAYIEFRADPERLLLKIPDSSFMLDHEVSQPTLGRWRTLEGFDEAVKLVSITSYSEEKSLTLLDAMYRKGAAGDAKCAALYCKMIGMFDDKRTVSGGDIPKSLEDLIVLGGKKNF
jgi:hypothetical protein